MAKRLTSLEEAERVLGTDRLGPLDLPVRKQVIERYAQFQDEVDYDVEHNVPYSVHRASMLRLKTDIEALIGGDETRRIFGCLDGGARVRTC
jgi:hypothetical protein